MEKHLHIVCLDVPYPVDYGGVFDLYYKLPALQAAGVQIYLHCFEYGRGEQPALNQFCKEVHYYERQKGHKGMSHNLPYIVASRANPLLYERLLQDDHPILLEGIHCTHLLLDERFSHRKIFLRLHNTEYQYYCQLAQSSNSLVKKLYYWNESRLLKKYEAAIANKCTILAVSDQDVYTYRKEFNAKKVAQLPVFLPFQSVNSLPGAGCFCLYHGNLSVSENEAAVEWLLSDVFNKLPVPFIIAGKNPSDRLQRHIAHHKHACLVANPSEEEMQDMIAKAQINVVPSFNNTGIKLKLLNALFSGRHCIVNDAAVKGSGLESACHVGTTPNAFREIIAQLYHMPFAPEEIQLRKMLLQDTFNNERNASRLIQWIW